MIHGIIYGGRVTDEWDKRLLRVYAEEFFCDKVIHEDKHKLGDHPTKPYLIPEELSAKD